MAGPRPRGVRRPAVRLLPRRRPERAGARALHDARGAAAARAAARDPARGAWPLLRVELPGEAPAFYATRATRQLDDYPPLALRGGQAGRRGRSASRRPTTRASWRDVDPAADRARRPRRRKPIREQTLKKRWCSTLWPTPARAAAGRHGARRLRRVRARARCSSTSPTRRARGASCARFQDDADRAAVEARASCASRPTGPT